MSRRLKGYQGLHFSLSKMHRSTEIFMKLSPDKQIAWSAFDRKRSRMRKMEGK